jgi:hypothetical protein
MADVGGLEADDIDAKFSSLSHSGTWRLSAPRSLHSSRTRAGAAR